REGDSAQGVGARRCPADVPHVQRPLHEGVVRGRGSSREALAPLQARGQELRRKGAGPDRRAGDRRQEGGGRRAELRDGPHPALKPDLPAPGAAIVARMPVFELWIAFVFSLVPHVAGLVVGGYGQIITNAPLAVIVTIIDVVALVIAYLQFREDSHARRASH